MNVEPPAIPDDPLIRRKSKRDSETKIHGNKYLRPEAPMLTPERGLTTVVVDNGAEPLEILDSRDKAHRRLSRVDRYGLMAS